MRISDWSSDVCSSDLPVDEKGAIGLAGRCAAAVDQHLGKAGRKAAHLNPVIFEHVGREGDAGHPFQHLADGNRFETLKIFEIVGKNGIGVLSPVAENDLTVHYYVMRVCGGDLAEIGLRSDRTSTRLNSSH